MHGFWANFAHFVREFRNQLTNSGGTCPGSGFIENLSINYMTVIIYLSINIMR